LNGSSRRRAAFSARFGSGALERIRAERARRSLIAFIEQAWPYIEPKPFVPGWHIEAIAKHLEAVAKAEIKRLVINLPPRHMKSLSCSVFFPAWAWIEQPSLRFLSASYARSLSVRDAARSRRLIESPWYRRHFGASFALLPDQNEKSRFENDKGGARLATSVGGAATGEGGDVILIDDPHNAKEIHSEAKRGAVLAWWDEVMGTRLNDPERSAVIIVMQRLHEDDLTGHVLKEGGWEHLMLPAEFEPERRSTTALPFADPRQAPGEPLWPARFPRARLEEWKRRLGSFGSAGQLQQRPAPRGGGLVRLEWFRRYREPPVEVSRLVLSWDTAAKPGAGHDYSACTAWAESASGYYLLEVLRARLSYPELVRASKSLASKWRPSAVLIEDQGSGTSLIQDLRAAEKLPVLAIQPKGDKITRLAAESPAIEAGRVFLPEAADWLMDFEAEVAAFPNGAHDDQVDSMSQFLSWVRKKSARPGLRVID